MVCAGECSTQWYTVLDPVRELDLLLDTIARAHLHSFLDQGSCPRNIATTMLSIALNGSVPATP